MYGRLIVLEKHPRVCLVRVGEMLRRFFATFMLRVMGPESTSACQDGQLFLDLKWELMAQSTEFKIFVTLSQSWKILDFYL